MGDGPLNVIVAMASLCSQLLFEFDGPAALIVRTHGHHGDNHVFRLYIRVTCHMFCFVCFSICSFCCNIILCCCFQETDQRLPNTHLHVFSSSSPCHGAQNLQDPPPRPAGSHLVRLRTCSAQISVQFLMFFTVKVNFIPINVLVKC